MTDAVWIGIDLGTQSVRAIAADNTGSILATCAQPLLSSRRSGREHVQDPEEWWRAVCACCQQVMAAVPAEAARGVAVDATSGTILLTDEERRSASEALMYDDGRAEQEALLVTDAGRDLWAEFGYRMQPSWALPKLVWLWRNQASTKNGRYLTHQNDFVQNRLAGHRIPTDSSHSLKSGYDVLRRQWPYKIFASFGLPETILPKVVPPGSLLGHVSREAAAQTGLPALLPILAGMTDGCAAQIAAGAVETGSWNSVLGTTLVLKGVTEEQLRDPLGVVYSHLSPNGRWLPGGASSTGAGAITKLFLDENLEQLGKSAQENGPSDLVIYPLAAAGERFPFTASQAQGFQLREPANRTELYRSVLQGVAFLERLSFDYLKMLGAPLTGAFSISGGATRSPLWNQIRADVLERTLTIPAVTEPAFGMSILAASHGSSLRDAAGRMVSRGTQIDPALHFAETYGETYRRLLRELESRGWLPPALTDYSIQRIAL